MKTLALIMDKLKVIELFNKKGALTKTLEQIEKEVNSFVPDPSTADGRKAIRALAAKVARSKTVIDNAGKDLTADWTAKTKLVNASRKEARDFLDNLKVVVRKPLTEWEIEDKKKKEALAIKKEIRTAHAEALGLNDLYDRDLVLKEKERVLEEAEEKRLAVIAEENQKREMLNREQELKKQAEKEAKRKIEQEAINKIAVAKQKEAEALANAERLKRRMLEAEEQAKRDKLLAHEQQEEALRKAHEQAKMDADELEYKRQHEMQLQREAEETAMRIASEKAQDKQHQKEINRKALDCFTKNGLNEEVAIFVITLIAKGKIDGISIKY